MSIRVCIVCSSLPPYYGGAELRAYRLAQRLRGAGVETLLIGWDRLERSSEEHSYPEYVHPVTLNFRDGGDRSAYLRPLKSLVHVTEIGARLGALLFALRHQYDILHVVNAATFFNLVSIPVARALNKPVVLEMTLFGSDDPLKLNRRSQYPERQLFPHRPLKYSLFLQADAYVSKSHSLSEAYRQAGLPKSKLFQIPSGVDVQRFAPTTPHEKRVLRKQLGLDSKQTIILFVGGVEERKGVHRLLKAFHHAAIEEPQAHLLIVGPTQRFDPAYVQMLHDRVAEWNLHEQVTFISKLAKNVHEYMKAADIFALPSSREGLSVAILEAMSSGLPIVASDIPEIACSQIQHLRDGLLVPVGDVQQLSSVLAELINNVERRSYLGRNARKRALSEFSTDIVDRQYIELYGSCLKGHRLA